ncbi:probable bifunctional dTTP/UTP pyrophosphatase/methyltransferase protein [Littorina saxatilis]|uniref:Uncharacterized protein n=1 Tax=Littorina saxatilis TaxID=31220 RepID=A0AAN9B0M8_9CAEN
MLQPIMHVLSRQRIVLASGSPRRKQILENVGLQFEVIPSTFEETLDKSTFSNPAEYVLETARHKTLQVAEQLSQEKPPPDLVIGADTVVSMDGRIFEKPKDFQDAFNMLSGFSGKSHTVFTGVVLVTPEKKSENTDGVQEMKVHQFHEATEVFMAPLTPEIVKSYIETGEPMDKAGGYGIQAQGGSLVEKVHGDYFNVMGFPLCRFAKELLSLHNQQT